MSRALEAAIERFYAELLARGYQPRTVACYQRALCTLRRFLEGRGKRDLRELERADLEAYLRWLERESIAAESVFGQYLRLRRLFGYLTDESVLLSNPAAGLRRRTPEPPIRRGLE